MLCRMTTRRALVDRFLPSSPFPQAVGLVLTALEPDRAVLTLPFRPEVTTMGDVVHGGAIATLIDTAGMAAAWADDAVPESASGSTVAMAVSYVDAARGEDLVATATVVRRGRSLCFADVAVRGASGQVVATGQVTHRFG